MLHDGVLEGRRTFGNIMKYVMMGTSSNFGNMFSMAGAALFLPFLPMLPMQILLNNLLYDVSEMPIPIDSVDEAEVARSRARGTCGSSATSCGPIGPVSSLFDFLTFYLLLRVAPAPRGAVPDRLVRRVAGDAGAGDLRHPHARPPAGEPPNPWLAATSLAVVAVAALLPLTPLGSWFGFVRPPVQVYGIVCAMTLIYLVAVESVKRRFFRWRHVGGTHLAMLRN